MDDESDMKVDGAAADLLAAYDPIQMPFSTIAKFAKRLKDDPNWAADEIIDVQTRVIRKILE